jgi:HEAT repeat protein
VPALSELLLHKRPAVRKHAISALAALKAKPAQSALLAALDDPDRDVRRAAAEALAELKVTRALPLLLALVERGQPGALQAVGRLAGARELAALVAQAPSGDVTPLKPALQIWLADDKRAPAQQLELIAVMTRVASPSARAYLVEWLDAAKGASNPRVRGALFAAIKQLDQGDQVTRKTTRSIMPGVQAADEARGTTPSSTPAATQSSTHSAPPAKREVSPRKSAAPTAARTDRTTDKPLPEAELARADAPGPAAATAALASPRANGRANGGGTR